MFLRLHFLRNLRTALVIIIILLSLASVGGVFYLNKVGLTDDLRRRVSVELMKEGITADFQALHFDIIRGVVAKNVTIYRNPLRSEKLAHFQQMVISVDKTKAMRGIIRLERMSLKNGTITVPLSTETEPTPPLSIEQLNGQFKISGKRTLLIQHLSGQLEGVKVSIKGIMTFPQMSAKKRKDTSLSNAQKETISHALHELRKWSFDSNQSPSIQLILDSSDNTSDGLHAEFLATAPHITQNSYSLKDVRLLGQLSGNFLTIKTFELSDQSGKLELAGHYSLSKKRGEASLDGNLNLQNFVKQTTGFRVVRDIDIKGSSQINGRCTFGLTGEKPDILVTGKATASRLRYRSLPFHKASTEFSWNNGALFLRNLDCSTQTGSLKGRLLIKDSTLRYKVESTILPNFFLPLLPESILSSVLKKLSIGPETDFRFSCEGSSEADNQDALELAAHMHIASLKNDTGSLTSQIQIKDSKISCAIQSDISPTHLTPFFTEGKAKMIYDRFRFSPQTKVEIDSRGTSSLNDFKDFVFTSKLSLKDLVYRDVPIKKASTQITANKDQIDISKPSVTFDYTQNSQRKKYGGPETGTASADRVVIDRAQKLVFVKKAKGKIWAQPILNIFSPNITRFVNPYKFHSPPQLSGSGVFDTKRPFTRTDFTCQLSAPGQTKWNFIGKDLPFRNLSTTLRFQHRKTQIKALRSDLFQGTIRSDIEINSQEKGNTLISGNTDWTNLSFADLAKTYSIKKVEKGLMTGRFAYSLTGGKVDTLRGNGNIALKDTSLFSVPIFGPLSPILQGLFADKRAGHERAKNASLTFTSKKGVLHFDDFSATTSSLIFTGDGKIQLPKKTFKMTIRTNGRGLLKLLKVPLAPLMGLFQFTGSGKIDEPQWKNTPFTKPPNKENDILMKRPPKAKIAE